MSSTLIQMALLIGCGGVWRVLQPAGLTAAQTRLVLTSVVYYLLLPAMIIEVLWQAELGMKTLSYSALAVASILMAVAVTWVFGRLLRLKDNKLGAMLLASAFPNITYLGMPVLEQTFGEWAASIAIQFDLFATTPLLFSVGAMIASHYGKTPNELKPHPLAFLNAPPFWAAAIAVALNVNEVISPVWLTGVLQRLSAAVIPLMLFSLGLALNWRSMKLNNSPHILLVILIKMLLMPLFGLWMIGFLDLYDEQRAAALLELAMPSMVLGIVFCDRYQLDSELYAMAVSLTTLLSMVTLPFWYQVFI